MRGPSASTGTAHDATTRIWVSFGPRLCFSKGYDSGYDSPLLKHKRGPNGTHILVVASCAVGLMVVVGHEDKQVDSVDRSFETDILSVKNRTTSQV